MTPERRTQVALRENQLGVPLSQAIADAIRAAVAEEREACATLAAKLSGECVIYAPGNIEPCWGNIAGAIRDRA